MVKKVTAPKTYNPGKGRPREHLAYLNEREMAYLRGINGNNMERGPRGLPSFPPDDSLGSSSSTSRAGQGGGGKTGGSGGSSGGATGGGSKGAPSSGQTSAAKAPTAPSPKAPTTPTSPMSGQKASFSSPSAASSYNKDVALKKGLEKNGAISAVKNTPAVKNDGVTGFKAQSLGVKSIGKTAIGGSRPASPIGPANRDMEINRNLDRITRDFYGSDFDTQMSLSRARDAERKARESTGLYGTSVSAQPRDKISAPARTSQSVGMTQSEKQALIDKYNPVKAAGRLADFAANVYNDPLGYASSGVGALGAYAKDAYNTIGLASDPRFSGYDEVRDAAAQKAAEVAVNFGLLGGPAGAMVAPKNSLGMWAGRMSQDPAVQKALDLADSLNLKNARPEDVFYETARVSPEYMSGVMRLPFSQQLNMVELADNLDLRQTNPVSTVFQTLTGDPKPLGGIIRSDSPTLRSYPDLADMPIGGSLLNLSDQEGVLRGMYSPPGPSTSSIKERISVNYPQADSLTSRAMIKAKALMNPKRAEAITGSDFRHTLGHELAHAVAQRERFPRGTNPNAEALKISQSNPTLTKSQVEDLAWQKYSDSPGEFYARHIADRLGMTPAEVRQYMKSFTMSVSPEDFRKMYNAR